MESKPNKTKKVILTGGHGATSALAVIEQMYKEAGPPSPGASARQGWDVYWIGPRSAFDGSRVATLEQRVFPRYGVSLHSLVSGKLHRKFSIHALHSLARVPFGFIHALYLVAKIRPEVILSFGGGVSIPVVLAGWILRIKVVIHEQTVTAGLANKISSMFASKIAISRKESEEHFDKRKTVLVGLPLLANVCLVTAKKKLAKIPIIYITCGSRGAMRVNRAIEKALNRLLEDFVVVHQTGNADYKRFVGIRGDLFKAKRDRYEVYEFIDPEEIGGVYDRADLVIARGGAHTVAEIIATRRPAVIIPIPWARYDEQTKNARFAEKLGIARVLTEDELSDESLLLKVSEVKKDWEKMAKSDVAKVRDVDCEASRKLVELLV